MGSTTDLESGSIEEVSLGAAELLAALGYLADVTPGGCYYHAWRVALVSERIASILHPDARRDVFYAGLLHDIGAVGAPKHITGYTSIREQVEDPGVKSHPQRGAALINWLPGMAAAANYVATHHEWWDGRGYPAGVSGALLPAGGLILGVAATADLVGSFRSASNLKSCLPSLQGLAGSAWPREVWDAFIQSTQDTDFYKALADKAALHEMIAHRIADLPLPDEMLGDEGTERALHLFAALVDLKDPSTAGHSLRVARRAQGLAGVMGLTEEEAHLAYRAGLVHDCGRLGVAAHLLNKSGRLTDKEMDTVRKHAQMTIDVLGCLPDYEAMAKLGDLAGHDHERFDGNGYPDHIMGRDIPLVSRILSVVDAFDSMVSAADYRLLTPRGAIVRVQQGAGTQFDPEVVEHAVVAFERGVLHERRNLATRPKEYNRAAA